MTWLRAHWKPLAVVLAVALFALWCWRRDRAIEERGAARARIERDLPLVEARKDSLAVAGPALDSAMTRVDTVFVGYDSARTRVVRVPYAVPGTTDTVIKMLVDTQYIVAADSLRQECGVLQIECARYRTHADSTIAAQSRMIVNLQIAEQNKGGWTRALQWFGMGAAAGVALGVFVSR